MFDFLNTHQDAHYKTVIIDPPALIKSNRDIEEGKKCLEKVLKLNPNNDNAQEELELILEYRARRNRVGCHSCGAKGDDLIDLASYKHLEKFWKWTCPQCQALEEKTTTQSVKKKKKSFWH